MRKNLSKITHIYSVESMEECLKERCKNFEYKLPFKNASIIDKKGTYQRKM